MHVTKLCSGSALNSCRRTLFYKVSDLYELCCLAQRLEHTNMIYSHLFPMWLFVISAVGGSDVQI